MHPFYTAQLLAHKLTHIYYPPGICYFYGVEQMKTSAISVEGSELLSRQSSSWHPCHSAEERG